MNQNHSPLEQVQAAIADITHVLPAQGPILDFVHENTIEGFQHLPFSQALAAYEDMTGIRGYMKETTFRECYHLGRITDADLDQALTKVSTLSPEKQVTDSISHAAIYRVALVQPLAPLSKAQLQWQMNREFALSHWQQGLPQDISDSPSGTPGDVLPALWKHILQTLNINSDEADQENNTLDTKELEATAIACVDKLASEIGGKYSLGGLIKVLGGGDILDSVAPTLLRLSASLLDEGIAAWHIGDNHYTSLYQAWRDSAHLDLSLKLDDLDWQKEISALPEDAESAVIHQLESMQLPREKWNGYLQRLCLEIQGWTGLINWRQNHPDYHSVNPLQPQLADWLAIRLTLDKLYLQKSCRRLWQCDATFPSLTRALRRNSIECLVRYHWQVTDLPETLCQQIAFLTQQENRQEHDWQALGQAITALQTQGAKEQYTAENQGWRLFVLCQHLGIGPSDLPFLDMNTLVAMLNVLDTFDLPARSQVWLLAYEFHYRDNVFQGMLANYRRGQWVPREERPQAQIIMCMDEREESFRRHLEELNPDIETLGVAGFFGVPMKYKGLDDTHLTPLCPVVVTPAHRVEEVARSSADSSLDVHRKGFAFLYRYAFHLHQGFRLNPVLNLAGTFVLAVFSLPAQLLHSLLPGAYKAIVDKLRANFLTPVDTTLTVTTESPELETSIENPRLGFTDEEQTQKVGTLLRTLGLTVQFAPLVALSGHGSTSQNNPHEAAHDCGACGGRQGGPNARAFAAMANRAEVRKLLADEGIAIPDDTWFVGLQHDTCSDALTWYDTDLIPESLMPEFQTFKEDMEKAQASSAHERCRRFYSANDPATAQKAFQHVTLRSRDLSQVRPEYGHATNASAVIGRRNMTQGLFLDRRSFLISYDPTQDPEGNILENILLTAGPVGAGINLEYYFSTIDNDRFGCGTKIPHNVVGLFGVMEGTGSDLRTGLPEQMIEIHEPMRLLVIVEHKTSVLARIYGDQPALQELIGGGWLLLAVKDPDSEDIHVFEPESGFVLWQESGKTLEEFNQSMDCYAGIHSPIAPALIKQPQTMGA